MAEEMRVYLLLAASLDSVRVLNEAASLYGGRADILYKGENRTHIREARRAYGIFALEVKDKWRDPNRKRLDFEDDAEQALRMGGALVALTCVAPALYVTIRDWLEALHPFRGEV